MPSAKKDSTKKGHMSSSTPVSDVPLSQAPTKHDKMPDPMELLLNVESAPALTDRLNIFPFDWRVETPRLMEIYESARDPGWSPSTLPWDTLDVESFTLDQRYAIAYWWALLSVFDASGP